MCCKKQGLEDGLIPRGDKNLRWLAACTVLNPPMNSDIVAKSPTRKGSAWRRTTLAFNCSSLTFARYCLTERSATGLPIPMRGCHSALLSFSSKIDLNLPIRESAVPWARRKGHWQGACHWQSGWWTRVRPPRSLHTRKATTSVGRAVAIDLGEDRLNKKSDSSCSRALFCLT